MNGLLTLTDLTTEKMLDLIDLALEMKKGLKISYPDKKMATLFLKIQPERTIRLFRPCINWILKWST